MRTLILTQSVHTLALAPAGDRLTPTGAWVPSAGEGPLVRAPALARPLVEGHHPRPVTIRRRRHAAPRSCLRQAHAAACGAPSPVHSVPLQEGWSRDGGQGRGLAQHCGTNR